MAFWLYIFDNYGHKTLPKRPFLPHSSWLVIYHITTHDPYMYTRYPTLPSCYKTRICHSTLTNPYDSIKKSGVLSISDANLTI